MAERNVGAVFTQAGVPVRGSADYQRVYDSRWRFMEKEIDRDFEVVLPAVSGIDASLRYYEKTIVLKHKLGFVPFFETDFTDAFPSAPIVEIFADHQYVFLRRFITTTGAPARTISGRIKIYNLPILTEYIAPKGLPQGTSSPRSPAGIKFVDGSGSADISDNSPVGFSVDSSKKILSIHRHGIAKINDYVGYTARVSAIDTSTNTLTIIKPPFGAGFGLDLTWTQKLGKPLTYFVSGTYPGGIAASTTYYSIPVSASQIKLASTAANARSGIEIDITSAGTLPATINAAADPANPDENALLHDVGYPPTFLLAEINRDEWEDGQPDYTEMYVGPMLYIPPTILSADNRYLRFFGVQALYADWLGYIILKDPAEIAG